MKITRTILAALAAALCMAAPGALAQPALIQQYPVKAIRVVVPFPPGGIADLYGVQVGVTSTLIVPMMK